MNITFPNRLVSFIRADKTGLIEVVGTGIKAEVETDAEDEDQSVLKLTLSSLEEGGFWKDLPESPIAEIAFIILDEAQPGTDFTLKNEAHVVAVEDPLKQIEPVIAEVVATLDDSLELVPQIHPVQESEIDGQQNE